MLRKAPERRRSRPIYERRQRIGAPVGGPAPGDVHAVDAALADDAPLRLRRHGGALATSRPGSTREALARLARQAVNDLTGPHPARLRACGDDECSGIFLDPTGRRRWCSDERCGVKARVRAHRARKRDPGTSAANGE